MQLFFASTLLLSAILMFVVEPMFAKMVLPLLGGSPSVWNTCLVFYQAALLAGYVYAHVSVQWLGVRRQSLVHLGLLFLPWVVLPIGVATGWTPPQSANPVPWLWMLLTVSLGLPFLCVSATAPLIQSWFAQTRDPRAKDPYFLYAASNVGSMIGLAAYPLIIESHLTLAQQSRWWAAGYGCLMAMIGGCAILLWTSQRRSGDEAVIDQPVVSPEAELDAASLTWRRRLWWLALSLVPSSLLLGVTSHLSTDIASMPLLWAIPLALYLLSFVMVFAKRQFVSQQWMAILQAVALVVLAGVFYIGGNKTSDVMVLFAINLMAFFLTAMVCHGQLAADRPASCHLTEFYLWMSVGGVVGGLFNTLVAPWVFRSVLEYPLMIVAACMLRPRWTAPVSRLWRRVEFNAMLLLGFVFLATAWIIPSHEAMATEGQVYRTRVILVGLAGIAAVLLKRRRTRFTLAVAIVMAVSLICSNIEMPVYRTRSFFGVLRVEYFEQKAADGQITFRAHRLLHGSTLHGMQSLDAEDEADPWTYYHRTGPVGAIFKELESREAFAKAGRIGVVGLGTGSIAAYARKGQDLTYFEIDPEVVGIAVDRRYFTYYQNCPAHKRIQLGDARLRLVEETDKYFNVLLIDAFSSDAIPVHLLTREAMQLYLSKLADHGLLAIHISNRHLDLEPVVGNLAKDLGVVARVCSDYEEGEKGKSSSTWIVVARRIEDLGALRNDKEWEPLKERPDQRLWTDDFSNIVSVIRWNFDWDWVTDWLHRHSK